MSPFEIVYDRMENGMITEYVKEYPQADRMGLVSVFVPAASVLS